jgi:beta-phosphoglucomutase
MEWKSWLKLESEMKALERSSDGFFVRGEDGVLAISTTYDGKVEFIDFKERQLALVNSSSGYPAYYRVPAARMEYPVKAVLMDLDGTSVRSEGFWIWIIEKTIASMLGNHFFQLEQEDLPYVSGHSVSEHLNYCLEKYCPAGTLEEARTCYFDHSHREMDLILQGKGRSDAFTPVQGLKEFLCSLKKMGMKIGLVTSGLYEKAWPEILSAFKTMNLGRPEDFYDAIITAGYPLRKGKPGTLGELSPKPHPWLYGEMAAVGLGIPCDQRHHVLGIEDSGAGICSIKLAGFTAVGMSGGNIEESGSLELCDHYCRDFSEILTIVEGS